MPDPDWRIDFDIDSVLERPGKGCETVARDRFSLSLFGQQAVVGVVRLDRIGCQRDEYSGSNVVLCPAAAAFRTSP